MALLAGLMFGLFAVIAAPVEMYRKAAAEDWPARKGVITLSYASRKRGSKGGTYFRPEICGDYLDTHERFCITRERFGDFRWGAGESAVRETVGRYPVGRVIDVHYDPANPKETLLEARSSWREMQVLLGVGIALLLIPVLLWLGGRRGPGKGAAGTT